MSYVQMRLKVNTIAASFLTYSLIFLHKSSSRPKLALQREESIPLQFPLQVNSFGVPGMMANREKSS